MYSKLSGFSGIWLRMSDLEAAISGLDANKGPGNDGVPSSRLGIDFCSRKILTKQIME
jgi:hypothetical protein